ncbi:hypothetical protein [Neorhizobium galegae]|uniref:hypothetical protein n=1 Tax=Neorhizobium galegae TaxID=399 RepID=UPI000AABCB85|nr:hypothetical protein [Neorhizobium galegae]MCQ1854621.1 hypothetical protein [Neorhizobium galegae]
MASDFYGGVELIGAAFKAVMLAVASNLLGDDAEQLRARTSYNRPNLFARFELARKSLRPDGET